jgi:hypothetical protein
MMIFQNPPYIASRHVQLTPRIETTGTSFSPLPCQAWHGNMVTNAHRVEVEVGADGHASAPPSGAAAAPPLMSLGVLHLFAMATALFTRAMGRKRPLASSSGA